MIRGESQIENTKDTWVRSSGEGIHRFIVSHCVMCTSSRVHHPMYAAENALQDVENRSLTQRIES